MKPTSKPAMARIISVQTPAGVPASSVPPRLVSSTIAGERRGEQHSTGIIDGVAHALARRREAGGNDEQRDQPERQIDVENPPPRQMHHEEAADQRPQNGGDAEHRTENP